MASVFAHDCKPICHRQSIPIASLFSCNKTTKHLNFNTFAKAYIMKCCQLKLNLAPQMKLYILAIDISQITEQSWTNLGVLHTVSHIFRISWRILHGSQFWTEIGHKFNYFMRGKCNETVGWEEAKGKFFMLVKQLKIHSITELVKIAKMIVRKIWDCHSKSLEEWAFLVYKKNMYRVKFALKFNKMCYVWLCLCVCVFFSLLSAFCSVLLFLSASVLKRVRKSINKMPLNWLFRVTDKSDRNKNRIAKAQESVPLEFMWPVIIIFFSFSLEM